ncbi:SDR family oxidoreductase [Kitasatospora sp. NPDC005856]|uniref:SDR family oxidoreductase n=1 Tax=Kitasatospora sp. NPDC005856 TaxID=3154566 RepID=UPI0033FBE399
MTEQARPAATTSVSSVCELVSVATGPAAPLAARPRGTGTPLSLPPTTEGGCAVVTGASSGIGTALAERLAARGYPLVVVARREDRLRALAERLTARHGVPVEVEAVDLGDRGGRRELAERLAEREVAVLCANAGFATYGELARLDAEREHLQVEVNVTAVHELTLAVLPGMVRRRRGAILITGSTAGNQPGPLNATYAASKAFANTFAESLHAELRGTGVSCTLLAPGPVRTEFAQVAELSKVDAVLPKRLSVSCERTADLALAALERGEGRVVPGLFAKLLATGGRHAPRALLGPLLRTAYRRVM